MAFCSKASHISAVLALAVAQAALADTMVLSGGTDATDHGLNVVPVESTAPPQTTFGLNGVNANGNIASQQTGTATTGTQIYFYSGPNVTPVQTNPLSTTTSIDTITGANTGTVLPYGYYPSSTPTVTTTGSFKALGSNGDVLGFASRTFSSTLATWGNDAYLFIPANTLTSTPSSTVILGDQGVLATVNTSATYTGTLISGTQYLGTLYYSTILNKSNALVAPSFASTSVTQLYRTSMPVAVNTLDQVVGTVNRYTGVAADGTSTLGGGTDAFLYNPLNTASPVTIIGLYGTANTIDTTKSSGGNTYNYYTGNNIPVAMNDSGSAVGTAARYQTQLPAAASAGTDIWLYTSPTPATTGSSTQIGLVGTVANTVHVVNAGTPGTVNEYYSPVFGYTQEVSGVTGINRVGQVAGTSTVYSSPTATTSIGQEAWIYTPVAGGGTATGYGTTAAGTYVQLGLTSVSGQSASTDPTKVSGYATSTGLHSSTVSSISDAGNAVGFSARYFSDSTSSLGNDAYFYSPVTGNVRITPDSSTLSNYISSANLSSSSSLFLNNGVGPAAVAAGMQTRFNGTTNVGTDAFAYEDGHTYVIASPALLAGLSSFASAGTFDSAEFFSATVKGVTDDGEVYGYFTADTGTTGSTAIGIYYFDWTLDGGTVLLTSTSQTALVDPLNASLPSGITSLNASQVFADGAGNVYGTFSGHAFSVSPPTAVPEPASLGLLGFGGLLLLRRRRGEKLGAR